MKHKNIIIISGIALIVVLSILIAWIFLIQERSKITGLQNNVYCQRIVLGMSISEVRNILAEYGDFKESESSFTGELVALGINFNDPAVNKQFGNGNIVLVFENGYLTNVREPVPLSDSYRPLCQQDQQ